MSEEWRTFCAIELPAEVRTRLQDHVRRLREAGVSTTVRDTRGREIDGACGQLAATELAA